MSHHLYSHSVAEGTSLVATRTEDFSCDEVVVAAILPKKVGTLKAATTIGDSECIVLATVKKAGADEHHVEAPFEDKVVPAEREKVKGRKATTTGDGTNDLLVSLVVNAGTVTSDGVETVCETVDTMAGLDDSH